VRKSEKDFFLLRGIAVGVNIGSGRLLLRRVHSHFGIERRGGKGGGSRSGG
jgi:hypothetical protein